MASFFLFVVASAWASSFASVIPPSTESETQAHMMTRYGRNQLLPVPAYPQFHGYGSSGNAPQSELFQPPDRTSAGTLGTVAGSVPTQSASGLSYLNNLLNGVNNKIYGTSSRGTSTGSGSPSSSLFQPSSSGSGIPANTDYIAPVNDLDFSYGVGSKLFEPDLNRGTNSGLQSGTGLGGNTDSGFQPNVGTSVNTGNTGGGFGSGTGIGTGSTGTGFGSSQTGTDFGNGGTGLGGSGGPATDLFGPGLTPLALDIADPTDTGNAGANQPALPATTLAPLSQPGGQASNQGQPGPSDPRFPSQDQQSNTWVWPDQVITGALPSIQLGGSASGVQANSKDAASQTMQQAVLNTQAENVQPVQAPPTGQIQDIPQDPSQIDQSRPVTDSHQSGSQTDRVAESPQGDQMTETSPQTVALPEVSKSSSQDELEVANTLAQRLTSRGMGRFFERGSSNPLPSS